MAAIAPFNNHGQADKPIAAHPIHRHLRQLQVSEDGARYVAMATDPFANHPIDVVGLPDSTGGRSLVYLVSQEITLTRPSSVPAGSNWDAHVAFRPFECQNATFGNIELDKCGKRRSLPGGFIGGDQGNALLCCSVPEGDLTFQDNNSVLVPGGTAQLEGIHMEPLFAEAPRSRSRLVAGAFKVVNTTAEIEKQGSVTCYRAENTPGLAVTYDDVKDAGNTVGLAATRGTVYVLNAPPQTVGAAKQLESCTHSAAEGALVVLCPDHLENPPRPALPADVVIAGGLPGATLPDSTVSITSRAAPWTDDGDGRACPVQILPFMQQGAYFTGLSSGTTLTVTCRFVIEVFPPPGSALYPLCREAAADDAAALEIAARIQSQLRPGYPSKFNSWGTFTKAIMSVVKNVAPVVSAGLMAGGPRQRVLGAAIQAATQKKQNPPQKTKKNKKK